MEATKRRYIDWWNHKGVVLNMWEHFQEGVAAHDNIAPPPPYRDLHQKWFDPEWRAHYLDWYVSHSSLKADILPVANTQLGPGSLAAILGGVYEGGEDTIWIHPHPHFDPSLPFDPNHPNYLLHKQLLRCCKQRSQGHYYVGMPDLMEGLDVLAALKGTDQVLVDTVTHPEMVERQMQRINDVYFTVFDELYDIIREGDEMAFCYFSSWAPGKMTKLQSDISTMISEDDYRRFVQPFIREQCQRIDYTLYHLDGVGAIRHLPALLEISELNAIQWTPGVGEPQGGSSKWYDLYGRILDGGKSVLASWVTLDELPDLLDHIGTEGVHIEMDFHNEQEVEQAMEIVAQAQYTSPTTAALPHQHFPTNRIMVLDGGMGTMIQQFHLKEKDFRGDLFAAHEGQLLGCNDLLCLTRPDIIEEIHRRYLKAGADMIETCTFNAQRISLGDYGLGTEARAINLAACQIARRAADAFTRQTPQQPRYVLGSVGPTSRICSPEAANGNPLSPDLLHEAYLEQMEALIEGGVDAILIETIFDLCNARIACDAAIEAMKRQNKQLPLMLSFSVATPDGHNMLGQSILPFVQSLADQPIYSVGLNCLSELRRFIPLLHRLSQTVPFRISFYPNAGQPDSKGIYSKTPDELLAEVWPLLDAHRLNIIGGCCGTTDAYIRKFAQVVQPAPGIFLSPYHPQPATAGGSLLCLQKKDEISELDRKIVRREQPPKEKKAETLFDAIYKGEEREAVNLAQRAIEEGKSLQTVIDHEMIAAMTRLGQDFEEGNAFVPQLLMAGSAMKSALKAIQSQAQGPRPKAIGRIVIGTVKGDLHDIGKNLVASMLEGCGFEVINIGIDVSADRFIEEVKRSHPDILCMSALLTTTMGYMREVINALEAAGIRDQVKVMVGGAPVTASYASEIGADGYSDNANAAVTVAKDLLS